ATAPAAGGPFDIAVLNELSCMSAGGDLVGRALSLFDAHAPEALQRLERAVEAGAPDELRKAAHALKSMSLNVGARALSSVCGEIERLAPPQAPETAVRMMRPLRAALAAALAAIPEAKAAFARDAA
ncbi:MAG: Hpt domain-containing protein, partial [Amphiplicatus sp.]